MRAARVVLWAMTLANAMVLVDQTAVPLALPQIMRDFSVGTTSVQWVLTASLLPLAGLLVFGGKLGDTVGRRRVLLVGTAVFVGASIVGGLAPVFPLLLAARVAQGVGSAMMLPSSVAIVGATFPPAERGRALGTMGGVAAIAGALGPTIGGSLTAAISWRAVLLVNVPLAALCALATLRAVPADAPPARRARIDLAGTTLLCIALVSFVFGFSQTQGSGVTSLDVWLPIAVSVVIGGAFVVHERRTDEPLLNFGLLGRHRNYLAAVVSQGIAGAAEIGLGVIFPLILVLNLEMTPALAGLALIPATVPMVAMAPLAGRWYDRAGGRSPLVVGYAILAASGVAMAVGASAGTYQALLPGLLLYGVGLALVLTTNDPVSLDMVAEVDHGQASGVSATAEQGGGAIGIAAIYALFHTTYVERLHAMVDASSLPDLTGQTDSALRSALLRAEATGLRPEHFDRSVAQYLDAANAASQRGYAVAFLVVTAITVVGLVAVAVLVRRVGAPPTPRTEAEPVP